MEYRMCLWFSILGVSGIVGLLGCWVYSHLNGTYITRLGVNSAKSNTQRSHKVCARQDCIPFWVVSLLFNARIG